VKIGLKVVQLLQVQTGMRGRRFGSRRGRRRRGSRFLRLLFRGRFSTSMEMRADFVCELVVERTGVRLLVRNAHLGQVFNNHIALHFQFACQFVNPNLSHA
jgi:hypothetical protein